MKTCHCLFGSAYEVRVKTPILFFLGGTSSGYYRGSVPNPTTYQKNDIKFLPRRVRASYCSVAWVWRSKPLGSLCPAGLEDSEESFCENDLLYGYYTVRFLFQS